MTETKSAALNSRDPRWHPMTFGRYEGRSIAPVFFYDPCYFGSLWLRIRDRGKLSEFQLMEQVSFISWITEYIVPPKGCDRFLVCYGDKRKPGQDKDEFEKFVAVGPNSQDLKARLSKKYHRVEKMTGQCALPLSKQNSKREWDRVARDLRIVLLDSKNPSDVECEKFFERECNFERDCWHNSLIGPH